MNDRELSDAFASLRAEEAADAPPFTTFRDQSATAARDIGPAPWATRTAWLVAASVLIVSAAGIGMFVNGTSSRPTESITTWRSPTDGLLGSTSLSIMTTPRIEAPSIMALPITDKETGK